MMSQTIDLERDTIETEEEVGFPLLGYTAVASLKGIEVEQATALNILTPLGLSHYLPGLPEASTVLSRAVRRWMRELAKGDLGVAEEEKILLRNVTKGKSETLVLALVVESSDLAQWGLSYLVNLRILLDKQTGILKLTRTGSGQNVAMTQQDEDLLKTLEPHWHYFQTVYTSADLGRMVTRIIADMDASSMRAEGGAYFVPYQNLAKLQQLKDLIETKLPAAPGGVNSSHLSAFPVIDRPKTKKEMSQLSHRSFLAEVEALQKDLQRFVEQAQSKTKKGKPGRVKQQSIVARLADYQAVKAKVQLYNEVL